METDGVYVTANPKQSHIVNSHCSTQASECDLQLAGLT